MNWRPENWENPFIERHLEATCAETFEAGAGAMLQAVYEEIGKVENPYPVTVRFADPRYAHKITHDAFEICRQDILALLQGKEEK